MESPRDPDPAAPDLALFRAFPRLRDALPRHPLIAPPTPVAPLALEGAGELYVKRDDASARAYGGNKPRKLEFLLGAALARGSRRLVTTGGLGSNHALATAVHGAAAGLATTLVLVDQPLTDAVKARLLLDAAWGADLVYGRNLPGAALQVLRVLARSTLRGERPTRIPTGGSSALGTVGFVSAAFELAEQVRAGALPEPAEIYVPVGTAGTQVGLLLGARLAGLRTRVIGVLVTDILPPGPARMLWKARTTLALLRRADPSVPRLRMSRADFPLVRDQLGAGYGTGTEAARTAIATAAAAGLRLDPTYSGKCLAAILARIASGERSPGPRLFWNTYDADEPRGRAPRPSDPSLLPAPLRRVVEAGARRAGPG